MRTIFAVLCLCLAAHAHVLHGGFREQWEKFKVDHKKIYKGAEEHDFRLKIFIDNLKAIMKHNGEYEEGKQTYKMAVNHFADWLHSEFLEKMTAVMADHEIKDDVHRASGADIPDAVDWRDQGVVTPVKDQGQCGSCWAFSATGALEGLRAKMGNGLMRMSEQNLIDCSWEYGNMGCYGGWMNYAFQYVVDNQGLDAEQYYPYEETHGGPCRYYDQYKGVMISSYKDVAYTDEAALKDAVATVGPVSVAINAGMPGFQFYSEGVYVDPSCSDALNHGVLAVGYGTENGQDYWLVKNSWNTYWGDQGYIKMARNSNNQCGIATQASYPIA